jgi:hypothetical protein
LQTSRPSGQAVGGLAHWKAQPWHEHGVEDWQVTLHPASHWTKQ